MNLKMYINNSKLILPTNHNGNFNSDIIIEQSRNIKNICQRYNLKLSYDNFNNITYDLKVLKELVNSNNLKKNLTIIYDYACNYLDTDMKNNNHCNFINGRCIAQRENKDKQINGCCENKSRLKCNYLINGKCSTTNIACKLFMCSFLRKKGISYKIKNIPLLKTFLNPIQLHYITTCFYKNKKEIIETLIDYNNMHKLIIYLVKK